MEERFKNIDPQKRDKIINAAIDEFAANGYEKASTNEIVKNAGISRGLLYHYFKDKEELYDVLTKYAIETFVDKINSSIDWDEPDIFERLKQITFVKIEVSRVYPKLFNFVVNIFLKDKNVQTMEDAYAFYEKMGINIQELFTNVYQKNIDYSKFREPEKIGINMNIIRWTIEKWAEEIMQKSGGNFTAEDMAKFGDQIDEYISVLKKAFY
ncbi:MAG: TetR/AcrR family transcriptional regulator [Clostridia bacterium]|nr:TetR/AcrR family transcriptional regulator [Clostridia bacterium]